MTTYDKIQTLWKRDPDNKFVIMPNNHSVEDHASITSWEVTEKIDGMNIRVIYNIDGIRFAGRTDKAQLPKRLLEVLAETFTVEKMSKAFDMMIRSEVILYGEGHGAKIQKGGGDYLDDQDFILFDVLIDGMFLSGEGVTNVARMLGIKRVPIVGTMTLRQIEEYVQSRPLSLIAKEEKTMEGVVCRSLDRLGEIQVFKLKVKDYEQLERLNKEAKKK